MKESKFKKHDKKRIRIQLSLYAKDVNIMKGKFGFILNATQAKHALLKGEFNLITRNEDPVLTETITQLRKIGNNINQLSHVANATNTIPAELVLMQHLSEIRKLVNELRDSREKYVHFPDGSFKKLID